MAYINGKEILFSAKVVEGDEVIPEGYIKPSGTLEITEGGTHDVKNYESAKIVDANLIAENIKKGVVILGVTGTYEAAPEEPTTVTFTIDGTEYTVEKGTTWSMWASSQPELDDGGPSYVDEIVAIDDNGNEVYGIVKRGTGGKYIIDENGDYILKESIITSGDYYCETSPNSSNITFTIDNNSYTVAEGTTWAEWAETTNGEFRRDEQGPDEAWIMSAGAYVTSNGQWSGVVLDTDIIVSGAYYLV